MDLIDFLKARIDEDEAAAKAASAGEWRAYADGTIFDAHSGQVASSVASWNLPHIARHDPARVLADVAAKRAIVDAVLPYSTGGQSQSCREDMVLLYLAAVYADHPDYRQEWKP